MNNSNLLLLIILLFTGDILYSQNCDSLIIVKNDKFQKITRVTNRKKLEFIYFDFNDKRYIETELMIFPKNSNPERELKSINVTFNFVERGKTIFDRKLISIPCNTSNIYFLFENGESDFVKIAEFECFNGKTTSIFRQFVENTLIYEHLVKYKMTAIRFVINGTNYDYDLDENQQSFFKNFIKCSDY